MINKNTAKSWKSQTKYGLLNSYQSGQPLQCVHVQMNNKNDQEDVRGLSCERFHWDARPSTNEHTRTYGNRESTDGLTVSSRRQVATGKVTSLPLRIATIWCLGGGARCYANRTGGNGPRGSDFLLYLNILFHEIVKTVIISFPF